MAAASSSTSGTAPARTGAAASGRGVCSPTCRRPASTTCSSTRRTSRRRRAGTSPACSTTMRLSRAWCTGQAKQFTLAGCCECIIHCDIKPENIYFCHRVFTPKIADFGMAKLVGRTTEWCSSSSSPGGATTPIERARTAPNRTTGTTAATESHRPRSSRSGPRSQWRKGTRPPLWTRARSCTAT